MSASLLIGSMATYETYLLALAGDAMFGLDRIALDEGTEVDASHISHV